MTKELKLGMPIPMINVIDVEVTIEWYQSIGFELIRTNQYWSPEDPISWAFLHRDNAHLMLNSGGKEGGAKEDLKLFFDTNDVDGLFQQIKDNVDVVFEPVTQFYDRREFEIKDINGYQLVFGQAIED